MTGTKLVIIADDLSGAAETVGALAAGSDAELLLDPSARSRAAVVAIDTNGRTHPATAEAAIARALASAPAGAIIYLKIDSLLRGDPSAGVRVLVEHGYRPVVVTAVPSIGRTSRDGVVFVGDLPLAESGTWAHEDATPPTSTVSAIGVPSTVISRTVVRSDALAAALQAAIEAGVVPICDAESESDLEGIAAALLGLETRLAIVASAGLARALGPRLALDHTRARFTPDSDRVVTIVGSRAPSAARQLDSLVGRRVALTPGGDDCLADGDSVVAFSAEHEWDEDSLGVALVRLANHIRALPGRTDLVLTGGDTARRVLDALGVTSLQPLREIQHGAVLSVTADGAAVVTRPGSYGTDRSLLHIVDHLKGLTVSSIPTIALTMGDGAGVGPEVCIQAAEDQSLNETARLVIIGDRSRLEQAAQRLGRSVRLNSIERVDEHVAGAINVIDLGLLPVHLPWGELSAVAGDAAFHYVRVACELAMAGDVHAIATAPLNKEALRLGGHSYPGHTELLAMLTGTPEVSMLLSTPKVKVIHVTTHIGLIDAIAKIEPGLVERTTRRGWAAMRAAGISNPRIGVCAINPHAGEHGLFGYGEEAEKITPAINLLKSEGMDISGPLPADTAFFLAGRGDYDLIVAMYHDQGHGPVKVLGIEAGTNITVGLPVIRTSVDHGTAFDIAGKGIADGRSMVEAVRQAIEMSGVR